jgi:hypothetical protein
MMKAPLIPGTRPVGAAQLAVEDTSTYLLTYYLLTYLLTYLLLTYLLTQQSIGAPARRAFPDHLITEHEVPVLIPPVPTATNWAPH